MKVDPLKGLCEIVSSMYAHQREELPCEWNTNSRLQFREAEKFLEALKCHSPLNPVLHCLQFVVLMFSGYWILLTA